MYVSKSIQNKLNIFANDNANCATKKHLNV
jgi:hypothetical protein